MAAVLLEVVGMTATDEAVVEASAVVDSVAGDGACEDDDSGTEEAVKAMVLPA